MKIHKYSTQITSVNDTTGDRHYIFYLGELVAFGTNNVYYLEEKDMRKKSLIKYIESLYQYINHGGKIEVCFSLNNMLAIKGD